MPQSSWLFICARHPDTTKVLGGGEAFSASNLTVLRTHADVQVFSILNWEGFFERVLRFLFLSLGYTSSLYPWKVWQIKRILRSGNFQGVFIDQSFYGRIAKEIKDEFPRPKVITQFHNIESEAALTNLPVPIWLRHIIGKVAFFNESLAMRFSDHVLFLTREDLTTACALHGAPRCAEVLPLVMPTQSNSNTEEKFVFQNPYLLFCGSYFPPNIQGITWFIEEVLPHIPYDLHIVGFGMERFICANSRVKNWGTVTNLTPHYKNALGVVAPIFVGGGMKTKTVEALSFGKKVFGTEQAFLGIPRNICEPLLGAADFISAINQTTFAQTEPVLSKEFSFAHKKQGFEKLLSSLLSSF